MKKIINFALVAGIAIGAASCAKDGVSDGINQNPALKGEKITFVLPTTAGGITYAIANNNEMALDLTKTSVYMFDDADMLEAVITDIQPGTVGGKTTATIVKDKAWDGDKNFVFVGNNARASQLPTVTGMSLADFQDLLTDAHSQAAPLATPLMLTSGLKAVADVKTAPAIITGDVSLYRNVARFDIDNNVTVGNVEIKKVYVNDARLDGYVFGYQKAAVGGTTIGDLEFAVAASTTVGAEEVQKEESLFYIYPTTIKEDGTDTTLQLVGEVNGVAKIFTLNKYDVNGDPIDLEIEANKRYIISAIDALTMTFSLVVADWEEGESIVGKPGSSSAPLSVVGLGNGSIGTFNGIATITVPTAGGTVLFSTSASTAQGTTFTVSGDATGSMVDVSASIAPGVSQTAGGVVYARPYYESLYEVVVPALEANETSITTIHVTDPANGATVDVYIYHQSEAADALIPINAVTFPDAAFRALLSSKYNVRDEFTQAQFDGITSISISNYSEEEVAKIKSVKGIEYFKNATLVNIKATKIKELDLSSLTKLTLINITDCNELTSLDLSAQTALETLSMDNASVTELDLSANTALKVLNARGIPAKTIDFSNNHALTSFILTGSAVETLTFDGDYPALINFSAADCKKLATINISTATFPAVISAYLQRTLITSFDASMFPALKTLEISITQISSIELSGNPALEYLYASQCPISSIELSGNPALKYLSMTQCPISSIDLTNNPEISYFGFSRTNLSGTLDLSNHPKIADLFISYTDISSLVLAEGTALKRLSLSDSKVPAFDLSGHTGLTELRLNDNFETIDTSYFPDLAILYLGKNIEEVDLSSNPLLTSFAAAKYQRVLGITSNFPASGEASKLKSLDISNNPLLTTLELIYCPDLDPEIKVWNGFPADPATQFSVLYRIEGTTPALTFVE